MKQEKEKEPKYYSDARRRATAKYRQAGNIKTAQLVYRSDRQYIIDEGLKKYGLTIPGYLRRLIENDYNGVTFNIPNIEEGEVGKWLSPFFAAANKITPDACQCVLENLSDEDKTALGMMCRSAGGVPQEEILARMAEMVSSQTTYAIGETLLRCFEAEGGNRVNFLDILKSCGLTVYDDFYPREKAVFSAERRSRHKGDALESQEADGTP